MTTQLPWQPIGYVHSTRTDLSDDYWGGVVSRIVLAEPYGPETLAGLDAFSHVEVLYCFHRVEPTNVVLTAAHPRENPAWPKVGIFAQRKKNRPNRIGLSTCRLISVRGRELTVEGLDAIDGTPVVDLKPCVREFLADRASVSQPAWMTELMRDYFARRG